MYKYRVVMGCPYILWGLATLDPRGFKLSAWGLDKAPDVPRCQVRVPTEPSYLK